MLARLLAGLLARLHAEVKAVSLNEVSGHRTEVAQEFSPQLGPTNHFGQREEGQNISLVLTRHPKGEASH